jgi:serine protease Do
MKNIKFGIFVVALVVAIGAAISVISAQDRRVERRPNVMVLDGRGAQLGASVSDTDTGVRIDDVRENSPAERAGMQEGDIVVEFDGERVRSARQLTRLVQETPDGRAVNVAVLRNGQRQTLKATPESRGDFAFNFDADRLRDEIERGMRDFNFEPKDFDFRFDDRGPRRFEYRVPERVMPLMGGRGRLGVSVQSLTPDLQEYFGATNGGALVSSVAPDSPASRAGLKAGDVITSINGREVRETGDLMRELADASGEVTIVLLRDRQQMTVKATIER